MSFFSSLAFSSENLSIYKFKDKKFCHDAASMIKTQLNTLFLRSEEPSIKYIIEGSSRPEAGNYWLSDIDNDGKEELIVHTSTSLRSRIYWYLIIVEGEIDIDMNRHQFARHLLVRENDSNRGVYEQQTISRRI